MARCVLNHCSPGCIPRHRELLKADEEQYSDTLNPPLFLLITLMLAYLVGRGFVGPHVEVHVRCVSVDSTSKVLLFRGITFSIFPVLLALDLLRQQSKRIDRATLRSPFYGQSEIAAPFEQAASTAGQVLKLHRLPYMLFRSVACISQRSIWYVTVEIQLVFDQPP